MNDHGIGGNFDGAVHASNIWVLKPNSFQKLELNQHPRCWPWSNDTELPYERTGSDSPDINEEYTLNVCIGPFGCDEGHEHTVAEAA